MVTFSAHLASPAAGYARDERSTHVNAQPRDDQSIPWKRASSFIEDPVELLRGL